MNESVQPDAEKLIYRGSVKHKNRPIDVRKGTLCPEWTHATATSSFKTDPYDHNWSVTEAQKLFDFSILSGDGRRRFATDKGIAFEAKPSGDGTWHGYPIPWEHVPSKILSQWKFEKKVTRKDIRLHFSYMPTELSWALTSGERDE